MCSTFCSKVKASLKGVTILSAMLMYQLLCFLAFTSLSIGFSVVLSRTYEYFVTPSTVPSASESFVCMYFISVFSEFHIFCQHECFGATIARYDRMYRYLLTHGSYMIYTLLYLFAFTQLYFQFEAVHMSHRDKFEVIDALTGEKRTLPVEKTGVSESDQLHTALFLLAMSYLAYCTSKLIHYDTIENMKRITNPSSCAHCVVTLAYLCCHFLVNILYSIPLCIVAFSLRVYRYSALMSFSYLTFVGLLSGVVFAVIETRRPWPTQKGVGPFFLYENNTRAKAILAQIQIYWILLYFYSPNSNGKIPQSGFNAGNDSVLYFCCAVGYNVLHFVKILTFVTVSHAQDANDLPVANPRILALEDDDYNGDGGDENFGHVALEIVIPPDSDPTVVENSNNNNANEEGNKEEDRRGKTMEEKKCGESIEMIAVETVKSPTDLEILGVSAGLSKSEIKLLSTVEKVEKAFDHSKRSPILIPVNSIKRVLNIYPGGKESMRVIHEIDEVSNSEVLVKKDQTGNGSTNSENENDANGKSVEKRSIDKESDSEEKTLEEEVWTVDDDKAEVGLVGNNNENDVTSDAFEDGQNIVVVYPEQIQNCGNNPTQLCDSDLNRNTADGLCPNSEIQIGLNKSNKDETLN